MMTINLNHMSNIPSHWKYIEISEAAFVELGKTPAKSNYAQDGKHKIVKFRDVDYSGISWSNSKDGFVEDKASNDLKELRKDDILITASAHSSEHIGRKLAFVKTQKC